VDDCSKDRTYEVAKETCDDRVTVLQPPRNQGVGGATILGYRHALSLGCDIVVKMDGDGQMDPDYLPALLDPLADDGYDYSKGNRFLNPEALPVMPKLRLLGNMALTFQTKLATGYWHVFDPQNGYTAIRAAVLKKLNLGKTHRGFFFENDMLLQLRLVEARVKDVAIPARYGGEESSLNLLQIILTFPLLLVHRGWRRVWHSYVVRDFSPIALFLFAGLGFLLWGTAFGLYTWVRSSVTGEFASTGTVMLSVLPFVVGFQLLLQAIVLDIQNSPK
jgi:dolichol-phosphate mannosyltransferase